jgi:pimeloyl-ACP methyl ester carboxylesterase
VTQMTMNTIALSDGAIDYRDTGGSSPVIVLLHGLLMDGRLWSEVVQDLCTDFRCIVPTLPLGAHSRPVRDCADLSLRAVAGLVGELLQELDLREVVLVGNDTGGALIQLLLASGGAASERIGGIVLAGCEAFDNVPPGLTGKTIVALGKLPPTLFGLFMQQMRIKALRRLPISFGWLTERGDAMTARWITPILTRPDIRRDTVRLLRAIAADDRVLIEAAERLPAFDRPALVVWAEGDRVMPPEHGRRLAALLPRGRLVEIADSRTLIPLDQPARLARAIREWVAA